MHGVTRLLRWGRRHATILSNMDDRIKDLLGGLAVIGAFVLTNIVFAEIPLLAQFCALFGILFFAQVIGSRLFRNAHLIAATLFGGVLLISVHSVAQAIWFYLGYPLGRASGIWSLLAAMVVGLIIAVCYTKKASPEIERMPWTIRRIMSAFLCLSASVISAGYVASGALANATTDSIRTPWPLLPHGSLLTIACAWGALIVSAWLVRSPALSAIQAALALAATTCLAPLIYTIGFGFDGFLHIAAEKIILATGTLSPKPLYYMGQYVFTTWISSNLAIPIELVDRWLVPAGAALLLPLALYVSRSAASRSTTIFAALCILPLAPFIATTPQSFAYLLGLSALILLLGYRDGSVSPLAPLLLASWSIAVHPLAGVPIFLFILGASALTQPSEDTEHLSLLRRMISIFFLCLAACSVPLLFALSSLRGSTPIIWNLSSLYTPSVWLTALNAVLPWIKNTFVLWPAWASLIGASSLTLLCAAAIATLWTLPRETSSQTVERRLTLYALCGAIGFFAAGIVLKTAGDFAFLIDYERGNYADRLTVLALLCLVPAGIMAVSRLLDRAQTANRLVAVGAVLGLLCIAAAQSTNALPRHDAVVTGHGWSVSSADIDAVREIHHDAGSRPYTVLADQSVSAAAVSQLGFLRYNGDIFFYPIPTGGALYDVFLHMTYGEPSRDTALDAAKLGGSDVVYVVLDDYWWNAANLADSLSAISDNEWTFGDPDKGAGHSVRVYKFDFKTPSKRPTTASGS